MAFFAYQASDRQGLKVSGELEAHNANAVADTLFSRGLTPLSIKPNSREKQIDLNIIDLLFKPKIPLNELVIFSRQMYSLLTAGIPIDQAITGLADTSTELVLKQILLDVAKQIKQGQTLSAAFSSHKKVLDHLMITLLMVGENTGKLDEAFLQLATYFEQEYETRKRLKAAIRYPIIVLVTLVIAIFSLNIYVIPTFAGIFEKFNAELPLFTRMLIGMSQFFVVYWPLLLTLMLSIYVGINRYLKIPQGRLKYDQRKLRIPLFGDIIERILLARYSRLFAMLLRVGVPMTVALSLISGAVGNVYMEEKILQMRVSIEKGESLLTVSKKSGLFTPLVLQMVAVGEETGRLDKMLQEAAEYYEREVDFDIKSLTAKIEPILTSIVAILVLILALGIFTPMWDMMSVIKGR